jgi:UDP-4-amino-4,6-dideoxy-N-acetyl-beta-L-altrosamine transaminase
MIPYGRQYIDSSDIKKIVSVLKSDWLTQGPLVPKFENTIKKYVGTKFAVSINSGTSALHISCLALGLKKGDYLWTVPNTFVASANCGLHCGAHIDFVDIDNKTWNMSTELLEKKLEYSKKKNKLPKIVIPVHFSGQSTDQEKIWQLSKKYKFKIIEDASHSLGGLYKKQRIGSCKWSDITIFSFHPVKPITTGEGGMALIKNKGIYFKLLKYRNHGITNNYFELKKKINSHWYYEQQFLGFNYRMNDLEASLGLNQLKKLNYFIKKRNLIAKRYISKLKNLPVQLPYIEKFNYSTFHLFVIRFKSDLIKNFSYSNFFKKLRRGGIAVNLHYLPVHLHPYYKNLGFKKGNFPNAEKYSKEAISLPIYHKLSKKNQEKTIKLIRELTNAN